MSKRAEEAALKAYPDYRSWDGGYVTQRKPRTHYIKGYEQAEKDLALTWEGIRIILGMENDILHECNDSAMQIIKAYPKEEDYYKEILNRFNKQREKG